MSLKKDVEDLYDLVTGFSAQSAAQGIAFGVLRNIVEKSVGSDQFRADVEAALEKAAKISSEALSQEEGQEEFFSLILEDARQILLGDEEKAGEA